MTLYFILVNFDQLMRYIFNQSVFNMDESKRKLSGVEASSNINKGNINMLYIYQYDSHNFEIF